MARSVKTNNYKFLEKDKHYLNINDENDDEILDQEYENDIAELKSFMNRNVYNKNFYKLRDFFQFIQKSRYSNSETLIARLRIMFLK